MLSFTFFFFFKVNNQENARLDSFLNGTLDMSYEGKTLVSLTHASSCPVGPFSYALTIH